MAVRSLEKSTWHISSPLHNKLAPEDRPVHAWYRFVLSFPPHLVRKYLDSFGLGENSVVLDPFCGTGTTLVEAKKNGVSSIGFEANPMAALASRTKVNWLVNPRQLVDEAARVAAKVRPELAFVLDDVADGEIAERRSLFGLLRLDQEAESLLLAGSICPLPLHKALTVKHVIDDASLEIRDHLHLALAWTLVNGAGNIRFGPEVGITPPKRDADVLGLWMSQVERMAADLQMIRDHSHVPSRAFLTDSRQEVSEIEPASVDAIITSPPYPNEKDYTRTTRLESVILGLIRNKADLRALKQNLVRSNTRNIYIADDDHLYVEKVAEIQRIAREIEDRRCELGKTSGFEKLYHRVAKSYFGGMAKHLRSMSRLLKPGAMLAYVVGDQASYLRIMIRTGALLEEIAALEGYEVVGRDLFRTRWATATREQLNEEVVLLRWPGA